MAHPCKGCREYDRLGRLQGRMRCPQLGREIALEGCNNIAGAHWRKAQEKVNRLRAA